MSITKIDNTKGELLSQEDNDSEKNSAKSSKCSCINCDTQGCFAIRYKAVENRCQCNICKDLKKTSILSNKDSRVNKVDQENATKKIIREVVTRETIESLKRVTETMYEFGTKENFAMIKEKNLNEQKVISTPTKTQSGIKIDCCKKNSIGQNKREEECTNQESLTPVTVPDIDLNQSQQHEDNSTATKLSAQVMNVPYEDIHESVPSSHDLAEQNPLTKNNVFKRIKEIYDACSCKVCECISSKPRSLRDDICDCKPCQCQECVKLRNKIEDKIRRIPHSGCPCIRCDRKHCRGIVKNTNEPQACDCKASDTIADPENISKRCKCEPCQCIHCRLSDLPTTKAVKISHVDTYIEKETCQCSPCECIECKQIYSRTNPTIMCTPLTDTSMFRNNCQCHNCPTNRCQLSEIDTCKCNNHNIGMRKSFYNNCNDYDIRTVMVDNKGPFKPQKECFFENQNPFALFASLKNNYESNSCNKSLCKCTECECIVCGAEDNSLKSYKKTFNHNVMYVRSGIKLSTSITNGCKCTPCECEVCVKEGEREKNTAFERKCRCDICDCLNCDNASIGTAPFPTSSTSHQSYSIHERVPVKPIRSIDMNKNCDCNSCNCRNCKKLFSCSSSVKFYTDGKSVERRTRRLRKVMLVSPSTSESRLKSRKLHDLQSISSATLSPKSSTDGLFRQDLSTCHAVSDNYAPIGHSLNTHKNDVCQIYQDSKEYNFVSDNDLDGDIFFKLNNPVLDTASLKSIEETPILNYSCKDTQSCSKIHKTINQIQYKPSQTKYRNVFNIVHEQPNTINSNKSNDTLPIYWARSKEKICCPNMYKNTKKSGKKIRTTSKNYLSDYLNKKQCSKNTHDNFCEEIEADILKESLKENNKLKSDDLIEYIKRTYSDVNCPDGFDSVPVDNLQHSHKYKDKPLVKDNQEYKNSIVDYSNITLDYERAAKVLSEAKAFSSKLIKMLDSFETANRKFESVSQKFKVIHESLLDINESELNNTYNNQEERLTKPLFEKTFANLTQRKSYSEKFTTEIQKDVNEAEREFEKTINKSDDLCDNFQYTEEFPINITLKNINGDQAVEKINDIQVEENIDLDDVNETAILQKFNALSSNKTLNKNEILPSCKTSKMPGAVPSDNDLNRTDLNEESKNNTVINIDEITIHTTTSGMRKTNSLFGERSLIDVSTGTNGAERSEGLFKQEDKQSWEIFRKNLYINACPREKRTVFQSSALELDIKEAIQAISLQSPTHDYDKVVPKPNEALANLQIEVNDLLNMPLLQKNTQFKCKMDSDVHSFPRSKLDLEVKSMSSTASAQTYDRIIEKADKGIYFNLNSEIGKVSCAELKANFIGLRRVSDHTVLVKWAVPKRIADVQGYELLVDGRAVQKIFSPTRSMAVVTCLPHAARVLLTVRTIAEAANCGHAPASTIVYRPRMK